MVLLFFSQHNVTITQRSWETRTHRHAIVFPANVIMRLITYRDSSKITWSTCKILRESIICVTGAKLCRTRHTPSTSHGIRNEAQQIACHRSSDRDLTDVLHTYTICARVRAPRNHLVASRLRRRFPLRKRRESISNYHMKLSMRPFLFHNWL